MISCLLSRWPIRPLIDNPHTDNSVPANNEPRSETCTILQQLPFPYCLSALVMKLASVSRRQAWLLREGHSVNNISKIFTLPKNFAAVTLLKETGILQMILSCWLGTILSILSKPASVANCSTTLENTDVISSLSDVLPDVVLFAQRQLIHTVCHFPFSQHGEQLSKFYTSTTSWCSVRLNPTPPNTNRNVTLHFSNITFCIVQCGLMLYCVLKVTCRMKREKEKCLLHCKQEASLDWKNEQPKQTRKRVNTV